MREILTCSSPLQFALSFCQSVHRATSTAPCGTKDPERWRCDIARQDPVGYQKAIDYSGRGPEGEIDDGEQEFFRDREIDCRG